MAIKAPIKIHICSIKEFYLQMKEVKEHLYTASVLCTTGNIDPLKVAGLTYLPVSFADVTDKTRPDAFQIEQAIEIRKFLDRLANLTDLYFCCDSGESRSAALAAAWMHYSNQDEMQIWKNIRYHPNELVYHLQSVACDLSVTRDDTRELANYNRLLFIKPFPANMNSGFFDCYCD